MTKKIIRGSGGGGSPPPPPNQLELPILYIVGSLQLS